MHGHCQTQVKNIWSYIAEHKLDSGSWINVLSK